MTSHLESTADGKAERCNQFSRSLYRMKTATGEQTVLFGGDTNLRDKEVGSWTFSCEHGPKKFFRHSGVGSKTSRISS